MSVWNLRDSSRTFYEAVIRLVDETFGKDMTVMYSVGNHDRPGDYMMPMFNEAKADAGVRTGIFSRKTEVITAITM